MLPLNLETVSQLFNISNILKFALIGLINALIMLVVSYKFFQTVQQCGYKGDEYLKWLANKDNASLTRLCMLCMLSILGFMLTNMALSFIDNSLVSYSGFLVVFLFLAIYINGERKRKNKMPLVVTKRMTRLFITFAVLVVVLSVILIIGVNLIAIPFKNNLLANFRYAILCITPVLVPYLVLLAYYINEPYEKFSNKKHITRCKQILSQYPNLIRIGVTGSFAKTSVKEILNVILSQKYKVLCTPNSYNTPLGIAKTVKRLDETYDVFIAEMGARRMGDIKELTNIVNPNYAVITGVTFQHLETFKIFENIAKTKYEIIENMPTGKAVFSSDNKTSIEMFESCKLEKKLAGVEKLKNSSIFASDMKCDENGSTFTLNINEKKIKVSTVLLGKHNVSNICLAVAVADFLGIDETSIAEAINSLKPIKHRLEVIKTSSGVTVIDDSYNSNPEGAKSALEVLKAFKGKKFMVTPGIVELGFLEGEENYKLGVKMASVVDVAILVGRSRALRIREGLLSQGVDSEKIIIVKNLDEAKAELNKRVTQGDVVLFENDLPDKYIN